MPLCTVAIKVNLYQAIARRCHDDDCPLTRARKPSRRPKVQRAQTGDIQQIQPALKVTQDVTFGP